jgi:hypothetical protein
MIGVGADDVGRHAHADPELSAQCLSTACQSR